MSKTKIYLDWRSKMKLFHQKILISCMCGVWVSEHVFKVLIILISETNSIYLVYTTCRLFCFNSTFKSFQFWYKETVLIKEWKFKFPLILTKCCEWQDQDQLLDYLKRQEIGWPPGGSFTCFALKAARPYLWSPPVSLICVVALVTKIEKQAC